MGNKTINLPKDKWVDLCSKIDNEGLDYYLMCYASAEGFEEDVDGDVHAIQLFKDAQKALREFSDYLKLEDF